MRRLIALLAVVPAFAAAPALAQSPAGCAGNALATDLLRSTSTVRAGQTMHFTVQVSQGPCACDVAGATITLTLAGLLVSSAETATELTTTALPAATATATAEPTTTAVPAVKSEPAVTPVATPRPSARVSFTASGRFAKPCRGRVALSLTAGTETLARRTVKPSRDCAYRAGFTVARPSLGA